MNQRKFKRGNKGEPRGYNPFGRVGMGRKTSFKNRESLIP
jgi:hypothetical protein